jgi:hypothetical protein
MTHHVAGTERSGDQHLASAGEHHEDGIWAVALQQYRGTGLELPARQSREQACHLLGSEAIEE